MYYTLLVATMVTYFTIFFIMGHIKKNNGLIDIAWGLGFVLIALISMINANFEIKNILIFTLVLLWGSRLSYHLFKRNWNKEEDYRYKNMRKSMSKNFLVQSYFKIYMLQMLLMFAISIPIITSSIDKKDLEIISYIGIIIWITGYLFEVVGDYQLKEFLKKGTKGIMKNGLFKYTRHPNYFGESVMWIGIYIISINNYYLINLISPLLITYLLLYVSGIPLLEERFKDNKEFIEYAKVTSKFIPLPRKKEKNE